MQNFIMHAPRRHQGRRKAPDSPKGTATAHQRPRTASISPHLDHLPEFHAHLAANPGWNEEWIDDGCPPPELDTGHQT